MFAYPAKLILDAEGNGYTVTFRDIPEAITEGDTRDEALLNAETALESALALYVTAHEPLPTPSAIESDETLVPLSGLGMAKAALYQALQSQNVGRAELARRLGWPLAQVQRILDFRHTSKMEQIQAALAVLGLRLVVSVAKAA